MANCYHDLSMLCHEQGRYTEAVTHFERSLDTNIKVYDTEEHPDVAASLNGLGVVLYRQGRTADATTHFERSLVLKIKVHGTKEHSEVADNLDNMGLVLVTHGRLEETTTQYDRKLAIYIKVHDSEDHPEVAQTVNNMGTVLKATLPSKSRCMAPRSIALLRTVETACGRCSRSRAGSQRQARTMSAALSSDSRYTDDIEEHLDVANNLKDLGAVLQKQGRLAEAATHYERSLAIRLKVHGTEEHPDVAATRRNLQSLRDLRKRRIVKARRSGSTSAAAPDVTTTTKACYRSVFGLTGTGSSR